MMHSLAGGGSHNAGGYTSIALVHPCKLASRQPVEARPGGAVPGQSRPGGGAVCGGLVAAALGRQLQCWLPLRLQARLCLVDGRDVILRAVPGQSRPGPAAPSWSSRGPARPRVRASRGPARGRSPGVVEAAKCARQREECPHREQVVTLVTSLVFKMQFVNT